jgi:hypothetical protein
MYAPRARDPTVVEHHDAAVPQMLVQQLGDPFLAAGAHRPRSLVLRCIEPGEAGADAAETNDVPALRSALLARAASPLVLAPTRPPWSSGLRP